jgi:CII-binding regulator of phage lambda lysogenization HflD
MIRDILQFPMPIIDKGYQNKQLHDEIIRLVDFMLQLNKEKQQTDSADTIDQLQQRIQYTDNKINKLVYQLYNLTEEEIKIIEGT